MRAVCLLVVVACRTANAPSAPRVDVVAATQAVERAKAELVVAQRNLARQKQLHAQGEPQRDVDQAQVEYDAKASELRRAQKRLDDLEKR